ncbi:MAG: hypothetical protein LUI87_12465 [Lachnospiraceae bacterium]|nr:hypothetical protein [Lachnospiraceae bacterium]
MEYGGEKEGYTKKIIFPEDLSWEDESVKEEPLTESEEIHTNAEDIVIEEDIEIEDDLHIAGQEAGYSDTYHSEDNSEFATADDETVQEDAGIIEEDPVDGKNTNISGLVLFGIVWAVLSIVHAWRWLTIIAASAFLGFLGMCLMDYLVVRIGKSTGNKFWKEDKERMEQSGFWIFVWLVMKIYGVSNILSKIISVIAVIYAVVAVYTIIKIAGKNES